MALSQNCDEFFVCIICFHLNLHFSHKNVRIFVTALFNLLYFGHVEKSERKIFVQEFRHQTQNQQQI